MFRFLRTQLKIRPDLYNIYVYFQKDGKTLWTQNVLEPNENELANFIQWMLGGKKGLNDLEKKRFVGGGGQQRRAGKHGIGKNSKT